MPKNTSPIPVFSVDALGARLLASGLAAGAGEVQALFTYIELLQKWNKVMNLVGPYSWTKMVDELILDSFHLAKFIRALPLPAEPEAWDLGAGAGLPGIPLRILWQNGRYTMVDSREKRVTFLQTALARLNLPGTNAIAARVENFMQKAEPASLVVSRAFMPWKKLLDLLNGNIAPQGCVLFMALEPAPAALPEGWRLTAEKPYEVPAGTRYFWAISAL